MKFKVGDKVCKKDVHTATVAALYDDIPGGLLLDAELDGFRSWNSADLTLVSHSPQSTGWTKTATTQPKMQGESKHMATKITTTLSGSHAAKLHEVLQAAPKQTATVTALTDYVGTAIQEAGEGAKKVTLNLAPAKHEALGKVVAGHAKQTGPVVQLHEKLTAAHEAALAAA
jgi:hypothetical protein